MAKKSSTPPSSEAAALSAEEMFNAFVKASEGSGVLKMDSAVKKVPCIPTGALELDFRLGIGGVPRGRVVEIFGPEASGKTALAISIGAQAQQSGGYVAFIDAEHAFSHQYAEALGLDRSKAVFYQPESGEDAFNKARAFCSSGVFDVVIIDSVSALSPKAEIDNELTESARMAPIASLMSRGLRVLTPAASKGDCTVLLINQLRLKPGQMMGNPEYTPGGKALKYYSSMRLEVRSAPSEKIPDPNNPKGAPIGQVCKVKVVKSKVAVPTVPVEYRLMYATGIDKTDSLANIAPELGLVEKKGANFYMDGELVARSKDSFNAWLTQNPDIFDALYSKAIDMLDAQTNRDTPAVSLQEAINAAALMEEDIFAPSEVVHPEDFNDEDL